MHGLVQEQTVCKCPRSWYKACLPETFKGRYCVKFTRASSQYHSFWSRECLYSASELVSLNNWSHDPGRLLMLPILFACQLFRCWCFYKSDLCNQQQHSSLCRIHAQQSRRRHRPIILLYETSVFPNIVSSVEKELHSVGEFSDFWPFWWQLQLVKGEACFGVILIYST